MHRRRPFIHAALWLACFAPAMAQEQVRPIRVESRWVLVDLIATDSQGEFVRDLRPEEVQVFEDGKRREIAFLELREIPRQPGQPASKNSGALPASPMTTLPTAQKTAALPPLEARLVLFIDLHSIDPADLPRARDGISTFLREPITVRPETMLAAARNGLEIIEPFTTDSTRILAAMERLPASAASGNVLPRFASQLEDFILTLGPEQREKRFTQGALAIARDALNDEAARIRTFCRSLEWLARELGKFPGRKNVMLVSGGYRLGIGSSLQDILLQRMRTLFSAQFLSNAVDPFNNEKISVIMRDLEIQVRSMLGGMQRAANLHTQLRNALDLANRSRLSLYSLDARGLAPADDIRLRISGPQAAEVYRHEILQPQEFLKESSESTGGMAFYNRNEIQSGMRRALRDASLYYELGYAPQGTAKAGKVRRIEVRVARRGISVSHRPGYIEPGPLESR